VTALVDMPLALLPKLPDLVANWLKQLDKLVLALHPLLRETQFENEHVRL
jgi:hypothetical protein